MELYPKFPPPETSHVFPLKKKNFKLAILSNGTPDLLNELVESNRLNNLFDDLFSIEDVKIYKPDPSVYELPIKKYRNLVYRIDSYCLGRILYMIRYFYEENKVYLCCNFEKKIKTKIDIIIDSLLKNNIYDRLSIREVYLFHKRSSSHRGIRNIFC